MKPCNFQEKLLMLNCNKVTVLWEGWVLAACAQQGVTKQSTSYPFKEPSVSQSPGHLLEVCNSLSVV